MESTLSCTLACEQAQCSGLVSYSREYLGGGAAICETASRLANRGSAAKFLARILLANRGSAAKLCLHASCTQKDISARFPGQIFLKRRWLLHEESFSPG